MTDGETAERVADWAAGYAAGFAAGCDTSELGRLYQRALQERDAAEKAAHSIQCRLKALQARIAAAPLPVGRHANDSAGSPGSGMTSPTPDVAPVLSMAHSSKTLDRKDHRNPEP